MSIGNSEEEDRPSVGRALQQARLDARLTVDEVSTSTRVRVPIVQAIEEDDYARCGGDVYARGHIRTLARAVGLDGDALVAQYDAEHGGRPQPTPPATLFEAERIKPEPRRPNWTAAMVAAIVAVVAFVGFTMFGGLGTGQETGRESIAEGKPSPQPSETKSEKPSDPKPDPSDSAVAGASADKVTVRMVADEGKSWFSAKNADGKLLEEGVLNENEAKTFTDDEKIDVILGNAGAVQLFVNGKEVDRLGKIGEVRPGSFTKGDPELG